MDHYTAALVAFDENVTTSEEDKQRLLNYLTDSPRCAPTASLLPMEEMEAKLETINAIKRRLVLLNGDEQFQFTNLQFSALLGMPLNSLKTIIASNIANVRHGITNEVIGAFLFFLMKGRIPKSASGAGSEAGSATKTSNGSQGGSSRGASSRNNRDSSERNKCIARDGNACILMRTTMPEVCHILPFSTSATEESVNYIQNFDFLLYGYLFETNQYEAAISMTQGRGWSDKSWNMICLNQQLHAWWSEGLFALKYLETITRSETESLVQLQFYWMPQNGLDPEQKCCGYEDVRNAMLGTVTGRNGFIEATRAGSNRSLATGHIFEIPVQPEDAPKMKLMIDIQWAVVRLAALSGAAGNIDRFDKEYRDPWEEDRKRFREFVESWTKSVT